MEKYHKNIMVKTRGGGRTAIKVLMYPMGSVTRLI